VKVLYKTIRPVVLALLGLQARLFGTKRVRIAIFSPQGEILLVRGSIGRHEWELPGGALRRGEDPASGAARELREETGFVLSSSELQSSGDYIIDGYQAAVFYGAAETGPLRVNGIEIIEVKWFSLKKLPQVGTDTEKLIREIGSKQ